MLHIAKKSGVLLGALLFAFSLLAPCRALAASNEELTEAVRKILREHPDIILDVLKDNSELVLEIAQQGQSLVARKTMRAQWDADSQTPKKPKLEGYAVRGDAKAPVTIVAYSDYQCPYCRLAEMNLTQLAEKYKGKVRIIFKALPNESKPVAVAVAKYGTAAFMQDADKGWQFHDALFAEAEQIERNGDNAVKALAVKCGLDLKRLVADAASPKVQERLAADEAEAETFGIRGTPYFLVNDLLVRGAVPKEMFEEAILKALALKEKK